MQIRLLAPNERMREGILGGGMRIVKLRFVQEECLILLAGILQDIGESIIYHIELIHSREFNTF